MQHPPIRFFTVLNHKLYFIIKNIFSDFIIKGFTFKYHKSHGRDIKMSGLFSVTLEDRRHVFINLLAEN